MAISVIFGVLHSLSCTGRVAGRIQHFLILSGSMWRVEGIQALKMLNYPDNDNDAALCVFISFFIRPQHL